MKIVLLVVAIILNVSTFQARTISGPTSRSNFDDKNTITSVEDFDRLSNLFIKYLILYKDSEINNHQRKMIQEYLMVLTKEIATYLNTSEDEEFLSNIINSMSSKQEDVPIKKISTGAKTFKWGK
jgi:hypothetical protein